MLTLLGAVRPDGEQAVSSLSCCAALSCNSSRELFTEKRGSAQESEWSQHLRCFLNNDEFGLGRSEALRL
jgi:hypothetical protein